MAAAENVTKECRSVIEDDEDLSQHSSWRIALYYQYIDLSDVAGHVSFQRGLCEKYGFMGRIRISAEGVNGVLGGIHSKLRRYEADFCEELSRLRGSSDTPKDASAECQSQKELHLKYCHLRTDLSIESQLFDTLMVKETKSVISLFDHDIQQAGSASGASNSQKGRSKQSNRRRRRKDQRKHQQQYQQQHDAVAGEGNGAHGDSRADATQNTTPVPIPMPIPTGLSPTLPQDLLQTDPAPHLSAQEWNDRLMQSSKGCDSEGRAAPRDEGAPAGNIEADKSAIILDVRNCYESRVGHFAVPNVPTLLTNTRKYSDLPTMLATHPEIQERKQVFMYCTGGVRCERVSMLMQTLYPDKQFFQLKGGIQTYLKDTEASANLYLGKNFVFDPRRTDPVHFGTTVGRCIVCDGPHDDYDNGHAPSERKEARCRTCRMLILVCNACRPSYRCFGEDTTADGRSGADAQEQRTPLFCGFPETRCIHEGVAPAPELIRIENCNIRSGLEQK